MAECVGRESDRPLIGVMPKFVSSERIPSSVSSCDSLVMASNYLRAISAAGGVPVIVPIVDDDDVYEALLPLMDGFLLTGGADLDPRLYDGDVACDKLGVTVPERERTEYRVLDYAYAHDVPLLGICRGIQLLNVYNGGSLYEDLEERFEKTRPLGACEEGAGAEDVDVEERGAERLGTASAGLASADDAGGDTAPVKHWQDLEYGEPSHAVRVADGSLLQEMFGQSELRVNSMHHQGIRRLGSGLEVMARASDGLVESVRVPNLTFAMGIQWHPEYLGAKGGMNRIFERLVAEAAAYRLRK